MGCLIFRLDSYVEFFSFFFGLYSFGDFAFKAHFVKTFKFSKTNRCLFELFFFFDIGHGLLRGMIASKFKGKFKLTQTVKPLKGLLGFLSLFGFYFEFNSKTSLNKKPL